MASGDGWDGRMTPRQTRLFIGVFVLLSAGVAANVLLLQKSGGTLAARAPAGWKDIASRSGPAAGMAAADARTEARQPSAGPIATVEKGGVQGGESARAIQRELQQRGYEPGSTDGTIDLATRAAILAYEHDHGLALTAEPSEELLKAILFQARGPTQGVRVATKERRAQVEQVLRQIQQALAGQGYQVGKPTGVLTDATKRAIREFETDQGLPVTGRVSGQLVARLARPTATGRVTASR